MAWFRWHEGTCSDPKFHLIARKSGQPVAFALAIWAMLLERASAANSRGNVSGFDCESADAALGMPEGATQAIYEAMVTKGMIVDDRIAKWEERQPKKEDVTSTERSKEFRARQKAKTSLQDTEPQRQETLDTDSQHDETQCNAMQRDATPSNEAQRQETLDKIRIDKSIKGNIKTPPISPPGGREGLKQKVSQISPAAEKPPVPDDDKFQELPSIEFQELREFWDKEMRCEGPMAGFREYKTLKKARDRTGMSCWPGLGVILNDVEQRKTARIWNPGYEIGLGRYLTEKTWLAPVVPRASPAPLQGGEKQSEGDMAAQKTWENYQNLKAKGIVS